MDGGKRCRCILISDCYVDGERLGIFLKDSAIADCHCTIQLRWPMGSTTSGTSLITEANSCLVAESSMFVSGRYTVDLIKLKYYVWKMKRDALRRFGPSRSAMFVEKVDSNNVRFR